MVWGNEMNRQRLKDKKRVVVKVGSSSLTHIETGNINIAKMEKIIRQIADLKNSGKDVVLVTSGAQAVGISALNLETKPTEIEKKQAVASVGQASLMMIYQKLFREYGLVSSQVLITKDIIDQPKRKKNASNTFCALFDYGVIPVVNENDTVAIDEIEFGDNDTLSAIVAELVQADLLIILSDIDGLYDSDPCQNPDAKLLSEVAEIDQHVTQMATGSRSKVGTGGMVTKLEAGHIATSNNIDMVIANSETLDVLHRIVSGETIGTLFVAQNTEGK